VLYIYLQTHSSKYTYVHIHMQQCLHICSYAHTHTQHRAEESLHQAQHVIFNGYRGEFEDALMEVDLVTTFLTAEMDQMDVLDTMRTMALDVLSPSDASAEADDARQDALGELNKRAISLASKHNTPLTKALKKTMKVLINCATLVDRPKAAAAEKYSDDEHYSADEDAPFDVTEQRVSGGMDAGDGGGVEESMETEVVSGGKRPGDHGGGGGVEESMEEAVEDWEPADEEDERQEEAGRQRVAPPSDDSGDELVHSDVEE